MLARMKIEISVILLVHILGKLVRFSNLVFILFGSG